MQLPCFLCQPAVLVAILCHLWNSRHRPKACKELAETLDPSRRSSTFRPSSLTTMATCHPFTTFTLYLPRPQHHRPPNCEPLIPPKGVRSPWSATTSPPNYKSSGYSNPRVMCPVTNPLIDLSMEKRHQISSFRFHYTK